MSEPILLKEASALEFATEEEREDYFDYCAATEAIDEALEKGGIKKTKDFAKELGFEF